MLYESTQLPRVVVPSVVGRVGEGVGVAVKK